MTSTLNYPEFPDSMSLDWEMPGRKPVPVCFMKAWGRFFLYTVSGLGYKQSRPDTPTVWCRRVICTGRPHCRVSSDGRADDL